MSQIRRGRLAVVIAYAIAAVAMYVAIQRYVFTDALMAGAPPGWPLIFRSALTAIGLAFLCFLGWAFKDAAEWVLGRNWWNR